jgi:hypothetical protein
MHQCQRQRTVGAWAQGDVFVALVGRFGAARVDADDARAVSLGLLHLAPEMQVAGNRVAAPDQDQLRLGKELHFHADLAAKRLHQRLAAGSGANGAIQLRRTQPVEEARCHALALHQAHGAGIAVGQYRFGLACGNGVEARGDVAQRFAPTPTGSKRPAPLGPHPLERLKNALGVVGSLGVARHLGAQHAARVGVVRIALHTDGAALLHRGQQCAGIGAIVGAGAAHDVRFSRWQDGVGHEWPKVRG